MEKLNGMTCGFADIHNHLLYGVDDGAENEEQMRKIFDAAYADGVRTICATPHYHPGYFGDNTEAASAAFDKLRTYASRYPDLKLCLGNELRYDRGFAEWIKSGACLSLNGSSYVLVDFLGNDEAEYIVDSTLRVLNAGYTPILAHAERYESFHRDMREIERLRSCGVVIQIDAQSPFGGWGAGVKRRSRRILLAGLADVVASDAHNTSGRPPLLSVCYDYVKNNCGRETAERLFKINPTEILTDLEIRKEDEL